jgi:hypothetical protein
MKKIEIIQSLVEIANVFDQNKLAKSANTLTRIAQAVADQDDYKFDSSFNPDDMMADMQENQADDYLELQRVLKSLADNGEISPSELSQIQDIVSKDNMGFDEEVMDDGEFDYDSPEDEGDMYGEADPTDDGEGF